tara:strand:+ start:57751 stop:57945 length:195 start_codon:yes stop_codon:yes gene_type:complete
MAKSNLHIICGSCGSNKNLTYELYKVPENEREDVGGLDTIVYIKCNNCSTIHYLDDFIDEEKSN